MRCRLSAAICVPAGLSKNSGAGAPRWSCCRAGKWVRTRSGSIISDLLPAATCRELPRPHGLELRLGKLHAVRRGEGAARMKPAPPWDLGGRRDLPPDGKLPAGVPAGPARARIPRRSAPGCRDDAVNRSPPPPVPISTMRPRYMTAIRSAKYRAVEMSCVMYSRERSISRWIPLIICRISALVERSIMETGSSATTIRGKG